LNDPRDAHLPAKAADALLRNGVPPVVVKWGSILTLLGGALLVVEFSNPEPWSTIPAIIGSGLTAAGFTLSLGFLAAHDPPLCDRCRSKIVPETMNYCPECAEPIGDFPRIEREPVSMSEEFDP
jgi:hypothetical protein